MYKLTVDATGNATSMLKYTAYGELRAYVELFDDEFVVMPNHAHGIIWLFGRGTARRAPTLDHPPTTDYPEPDLAPSIEQFGKPV